MKRMLAVVAALVGLVAFPGLGQAAITFDLQTGTGSVDRSDVQQAFGWTNAQFGQMKHDVVFIQENHVATTFSCTSGAVLVGGLTTYYRTLVKSSWQGQFVLLGYGSSTTTNFPNPPPGPGDPCPNGDGSTIIRADSEDFYDGDLFATANGQSAYLGNFFL
jgi:hypothetical protein